jgi:tetratricopeptide (TPR) repeat protein
VCFGRIQGRIQPDLGIDAVIEESLAIAQRHHDAFGVVRALVVRSEQAWRTGNLVAARADAEDGLARALAVGDQIGQIWALFALGWILGSIGEYPEAQRTFERGLVASHRIGYAHATADMLLGLAEIAFLRGAIEAAETHTGERLLVEQQLGNVLGVGSCYEAAGVLALRRSDYAQAIVQFEAALRLYDEWMPPYAVQARAWLSMATAFAGDLTTARAYGRDAFSSVRVAPSPAPAVTSAARDVAGLIAAAATVAMKRNQWELAIQLSSVLAQGAPEPPSLMYASPADRWFRERVRALAHEQRGDEIHVERPGADQDNLTLEQAETEAWLVYARNA